ncbi:MAG: GH3 auxin-responsive promoter family protein [Bacteroidetes bacterium]|nr:GH3 auxin-responsive promoter family protein [Bacteroidota bacterium]
MGITKGIYTWLYKKRYEQIQQNKENAVEVQFNTLLSLIQKATETQFGKEHQFASITNYKQFKEQVPVREYEQLKQYIELAMKGQANVLWPGMVKWFAKSSGTTQDRSKFIPITPECMEDCHYQGGKDVIGLLLSACEDSKIIDGRTLALGGSRQINQLNEGSYYGDLSAVLTQNLPVWAEILRTPDIRTALHPDYEEKIELMAEKTMNRNVTNVVGVPTWTVVLFNKILEKTGKKNMLEVWPNLDVFVHGGVSFEPYREMFKTYLPGDQVKYIETYNASEGFFALQDHPDDDDMLLMVDYGIFYEFIPMEEFDKENPATIALDEVEVGKNYAVVISSNAGLWRYKIGDTIKFTSTAPHRIKVTGRTKHFINAFGEEIIIENAETALAAACDKHNCSVTEFTAGPVYFSEKNDKGAHEWMIEFENEPSDVSAFAITLDTELRKLNSDYDAKRDNDMALTQLQLTTVPKGTFFNWMKQRGKLGGQNKVPRLKNDRKILEDLKAFLAN